MAKIRNWSRQQSKERKTRPYVWKNTKSNERVEITELGGGGYRIKSVSGSGQRTLKTKNTKEAARKWAVNWMENHPM